MIRSAEAHGPKGLRNKVVEPKILKGYCGLNRNKAGEKNKLCSKAAQQITAQHKKLKSKRDIKSFHIIKNAVVDPYLNHTFTVL